MTHPEEFQSVVEPILGILKTRLKQIDINNLLKERQINNKFKEHKDSKVIQPLEIPLAIVGARYDEFQVNF